MDNLREKLCDTGLSKTASQLISECRRPSSSKNYESAWKKWVGWCAGREIDPFQCDINSIINYLAFLFQEGYEYRTICLHRSAISAYHDSVDGKQIGENSQISHVLKGIFNNRPPKPRYPFIWDMQLVVDYIKQHWPNNNTLNDKELTFKVTILIALTSASRSLGIKHLSLSSMSTLPHCYKFFYSKLHKGWKAGQQPPSVVFHKFEEDETLCVVSVLNEYIKRSESWRGDKTQLLLSYVAPHREVTSSKS